MANLQVGDAVLGTDVSGETFFDQVYLFGHTVAHVKTMLKRLELHSEEQKWSCISLRSTSFRPAAPTRRELVVGTL